MTVNQRKFARLAAQGQKLIDAHTAAYGPGNGKRKNKNDDASKLAKKPDVRALIAEYEAQLTPIGDLRQCRLNMLANIQNLAYNSPDQKVRLAASIDLRNYIDAQVARERALMERQPVNVESLITEIQQLQQPAETIELEAIEDKPADTDSAPGE